MRHPTSTQLWAFSAQIAIHDSSQQTTNIRFRITDFGTLFPQKDNIQFLLYISIALSIHAQRFLKELLEVFHQYIWIIPIDSVLFGSNLISRCYAVLLAHILAYYPHGTLNIPFMRWKWEIYWNQWQRIQLGLFHILHAHVPYNFKNGVFS